jgi:hypothetical protein
MRHQVLEPVVRLLIQGQHIIDYRCHTSFGTGYARADNEDLFCRHLV